MQFLQINVCPHSHPLVIIVVVLCLSVGITELDLMEYPIEYLLPKLVSSCLRGWPDAGRAGFSNEEVQGVHPLSGLLLSPFALENNHPGWLLA